MSAKRPETLAFEHIRLELQTHLDRSGAPEEIRPFLLDHWAKLMTGIYMAKGNQDADWVAGWDTVNALLWSLAPKKTRADSLALLRILPTLMDRLSEGCDALGFKGQARDQFFSNLALMHAAISRAGLQLNADDPLELPTSLGRDQPLPAEALGGLRADPLGGPDTIQASTGSMAGPVDVTRLKCGDWIVFSSTGGSKRLRLTWISPQHGMYLFANQHGQESLSLTRARLVTKFKAGEAWLEGA